MIGVKVRRCGHQLVKGWWRPYTLSTTLPALEIDLLPKEFVIISANGLITGNATRAERDRAGGENWWSHGQVLTWCVQCLGSWTLDEMC